MRKIKLEEFVPQAAEFRLAKNSKTYKLRAWNLGDASWAKAVYGEKAIEEFFGPSPEPMMIAAFAFRLMDDKDQDDFAPIPCRFRDLDGTLSEQTQIGGAALLANWVEGPAETLKILLAVKTAIGLSQPLLDRIKKKAAEAFAGDGSQKKPSTTGG